MSTMIDNAAETADRLSLGLNWDARWINCPAFLAPNQPLFQHIMGSIETNPDVPFAFHELTISQYHSELIHGRTTCVATITAYITRINQYNSTLKAILAINPNALHEAHQKDQELASCVDNTGKDNPKLTLQPLHGVPVILKDTYTTAFLPTTSGVRALRTLTTDTSCTVVQNLLNNGAVILAKSNLHEFSLEGITLSSLGGQTLNPYDLTRTPGGSSGGTAVALATNMGLVGCGGDTMNSLRSPASACAVVGFRPTRGQVSRRGIVPVTETQDVAGPMGRTVGDVQILFEAMRGEDMGDPATLNPLRYQSPSYIYASKIKLGILKDYFSDGTTTEGLTINKTIYDALARLRSNSPYIDLVEIPHMPDWDVLRLRTKVDTQAYEFRTVLDAFLNSQTVTTPHKSLAAIAASGQYNSQAMTAVLDQTLQGGEFTPTSPEYYSRLERIESLKESVERCYQEYELTALVYPHQRQLVASVGCTVQPGRNGILAALTGRPAICFPAGFSPETPSAPLGIPIGIELMGQPWKDQELLGIAQEFESVLTARKPPISPLN
ncbi:amidase signature domain-containing protein [Aspergillus pseudocaelatus]|uniref:Amidase signature domain-containing protein n=1 Tax=Aspergillus pseudocaelatus TaxID=1825620 RepID=A0ABQ6WQA1_9EURO|nr:amidase signature domain-containing protein [Aspergillus pseudocaelatus]